MAELANCSTTGNRDRFTMHLLAATHPPSCDEGFLSVTYVEVLNYIIYRSLKSTSAF